MLSQGPLIKTAYAIKILIHINITTICNTKCRASTNNDYFETHEFHLKTPFLLPLYDR